jgi:hypothetical protein
MIFSTQKYSCGVPQVKVYNAQEKAIKVWNFTEIAF